MESLAELRREDDARLAAELGQRVDAKQHSLAALNEAYGEDGAVLFVPRGADLHQPVHLAFVSTGSRPAASHPRVLVVAGEGSRATVIQDHVSIDGGVHFTNAVTELSVGANASLRHVLLQREEPGTFHVSNLGARVERSGRLSTHTLTLGGRLVRNDLAVLLADEGAECGLDGLFLGTDDQLVDNHTLVDHAMPHGTSRELYKGILGGRSRGVFRGRVVVRPDAQKTAATQSNPNLLLADGAEVDTKPQLEIHADDVKCSHGSTIGQLDPDALFYLRSRGIGHRQALDLLTRGFAAEILERLEVPALGDAVGELLLARLDEAARRQER